MNKFESLAARTPLFAEMRGDIEVSFEFFPPKTDKMAETLWESVKTLEPLHPRFVSVTYGAGGSTRERTHQTVERILKETSLTPAAHLTCVAASKAEVDEIFRWLTGYSQTALESELAKGTNFEDFFGRAPALNPARALITGVVCGVRVETIEDPLMKEIRYLDKLIDELAKGRAMAKILRG